MSIMDVLEELNDLEEEQSDTTPQGNPRIIDTEIVTEADPEPDPATEPEPTPEAVPEPDTAASPRRGLRPEWIMGIVAAAAALLLLAAVVVCRPYFPGKEEASQEGIRQTLPPRTEDTRPLLEQLREEDPEAARNEADFLEPEDAGEEPENPTVPPERNPYDQYDFQYDRHNYLKLQNLNSYAGIDVSAFQGKIDWKKVKESGIDFAIIRLGYRGYESGKLVEDDYAKANLKGASEAGLKVGAYFFSQALTINETDEEIRFMLKILGDTKLDMPIVLDWEIPASTARTQKMDARTLTDIQRHFCGQMRDRGYQPMIYFNWHQSENLYFLSDLEEYPFWLALYQDRMTYPWKVEMWQYSDKGRVPGIQGNVDLNVYMPD